MQPNKMFAIFKAKEKKSEKSPDYTISMKTGDVYTTIGGCWLKDGKGGKFFSCKLSNGSERFPGFSIVQDEQKKLSAEDVATIQALRAGEATKTAVKDELDEFAASVPF